MSLNDFLISKKIAVKPIFRDRGGIYSLNKDSNFLNEGAKESFEGLKNNSENGRIVKINPFSKLGNAAWQQELDKETLKELSVELGLEDPSEFNIHKKGGFWEKFKVVLDKRGDSLELSNPTDFVKARFLLSYRGLIASCEAEKFSHGSNRYVLIDEEEVANNEVEKQDLTFEAFEKFAAIRSKRDNMYGILLIHYMESAGNESKPNPNYTVEQLRSEIGKLITKSPERFISLVDDKKLKTKDLLYRCLDKGIISQDGVDYVIPNVGVIGTAKQTIEWLDSIKNQAVKAKLINDLKDN